MNYNNRAATRHFNEHANVYLFLTMLFLIGVIFGAIIVNSMNFTQKQDLYFYLHQFFGQVIKGPVGSKQMLFQSSLFYHLKYLLVIFILGLSIIGMPIIWVLLFMKGIVVGFSVGFLVNQMGWHGLLLAAASIAPQNLLIIPAYLIAGSLAMIFSLTLIQKLTAKKNNHPLLQPFFRYSIIFLGLFGIVVVAALVESYLSPQAMKQIIDWTYK